MSTRRQSRSVTVAASIFALKDCSRRSIKSTTTSTNEKPTWLSRPDNPRPDLAPPRSSKRQYTGAPVVAQEWRAKHKTVVVGHDVSVVFQCVEQKSLVGLIDVALV